MPLRQPCFITTSIEDDSIEMASGIGVNGGTDKCEGKVLTILLSADADKPMDCNAFREDYLECLHHFKEFRRVKIVQEEAERQRKEKAASDKAAMAAAKRAAADAVSK